MSARAVGLLRSEHVRNLMQSLRQMPSFSRGRDSHHSSERSTRDIVLNKVPNKSEYSSVEIESVLSPRPQWSTPQANDDKSILVTWSFATVQQAL